MLKRLKGYKNNDSLLYTEKNGSGGESPELSGTNSDVRYTGCPADLNIKGFNVVVCTV
ncbi:hypothetical protein KTH_31940 [Thermosporothrix hazakensis]|uniref:Uncharacterized protein n=1 Tax=Thermosporothrix sp. COM3 TaxID=2490863 RepID=A0A455SS48_9CHLR|nr:hypothetical protein KTC_50390 [Thermosporothrix sp. COM3]GCE48325.1 hypothetical protein KTH_31940 [Thermosporothrix hazakensis]